MPRQKPHYFARRRGTATLGVLAVAGLLTALGSSVGTAATSTPQQRGTEKWQQAMENLRVPGKGCFAASFPKVAWLRTRCKKAPRHAYPPVHGLRPQVVGNGTDYSAEVSGVLTSATGTFGSITPGATETGQQNGAGPQHANTYSLQLNVKPFMTSKCGPSPNPGCLGWEQFLYTSTYNQVFIQNWLLKYNTTCPAGWITFTFPPPSTDTYCYQNSTANTLSGSVPPVSSLPGVTLTGSANGGGTDSVVMTAPTGHATATSADSLLHLASNWKGVEFAVVGDCCGTQAKFSAGTTLNVRTTVHSGTHLAPMCVVEGFTGETNNLNLAPTPAIGTPAAPTIASDQSTTSAGMHSCVAASGTGDTHLHTFRNVLDYDFQATGDYVLATTGPNFLVENRQRSGAPTYPLAAMNQDVAARIGKSVVAVCLASASTGAQAARLVVNNKTVNLASGAHLSLPGGDDVSRSGNAYLFQGASGDSLLAQVNFGAPDWIDATVGLGRWPEAVHGILANAANHNPLSIATRSGTILTAPFAFNQFYNDYGRSWRVPAGPSLLGPCDGKIAFSNPKTIFYAGNLDPKLARPARDECAQAGVKAPGLLDDCTLDVAVLQSKSAILPYLSLPANIKVGLITLPPFDRVNR